MNISEIATDSFQSAARDLEHNHTKSKLRAGDRVARRELMTISGQSVCVPDPHTYVHLQFRRFAGCPICDLHLRSFVRHHQELAEARVREVVVFHSPAKELIRHADDLPFAVIADPQKQLYAEFGVGTSVSSLLDPRALGSITKAVTLRAWEMLRGRKSAPALHIPGGRLGLPADFLLASDETVIAAKYGIHAYDQWTIDQLLSWISCRKAGIPVQPGDMESPKALNQALRQRIRALPGVTEREKAGIHEDAFFVAGKMFMHVHGLGHCDIRLSKADQERVLAEGKGLPHRWAPQAGYVTFLVKEAKDLKPAMDLIRLSHQTVGRVEQTLE